MSSLLMFRVRTGHTSLRLCEELHIQWRSSHPLSRSTFRTGTSCRSFGGLTISKKVREALAAQKPVVCLESTIITHGMDFPANLRMARAVERVIEDNGCVPATIAVLNGRACVGLEDHELELLARTGRKARKISRRDMAAGIADGATGGTTVSGTMILAKKAGIQVFVTGGIGGVHRGAEITMDISNDLNELSRNDVAVVCAGPKAILDIPRTLEYLETMGVTVTTVGQSNLPAFYSRDSGIKSPQESPTAEHAASLIAANKALELGSSVLVCVPIPEDSSIDSVEMQEVIQAALVDSEAAGIQGKDSTPYLLAAVSRATQGRSLEANIALVMENARVGSQIAFELARLNAKQAVAESRSVQTLDEPLDLQLSDFVARSLEDLESGKSIAAEYPKDSILQSKTVGSSKMENELDVLVIGGVAVDLTCAISVPSRKIQDFLHTSTPGSSQRSVGGVAGNIARAARLLGSNVSLVTVLGRASPETETPDSDGQYILSQLAGIQTHISTIPNMRTASYTCIQANGELLAAVADMEIFTQQARSPLEGLSSNSYGAIILDANIPTALSQFVEQNLTAKIVCFEPTSVRKSTILFESKISDGEDTIVQKVWPKNAINLCTPNLLELAAMFFAAQKMGYFESEEWWELVNSINITSVNRQELEHFLKRQERLKHDLLETGAIQQAIHLLPYLQNIYLTMGSSGVLSFHLLPLSQSGNNTNDATIFRHEGLHHMLQIVHHKPEAISSPIISDTGAGDTFTGVLVSALLRGTDVKSSVQVAQKAAILTLASAESVSPLIEKL